MALTLVPPAPEPPAAEFDPAALRRMVPALIDALDASNEHLRSMFDTCLRLAYRHGACSRAARRGLRLVGPDSPATEDDLLRAAAEALRGALAAPLEDLDRQILELTLDSVDRHLERERRESSRLARSEINREVDAYMDRWRRSDLPGRPHLRPAAKRCLVEAQLETLDLVRRATDDELLAVPGIGPTFLKQIRALCSEAV